VRLLFDENLSPRLVRRLDAAFPDSQHVELAGLRGHPDLAIWEYAQQHDLIVVSKYNDFRQLSFLKGSPPKVIWLMVGNAGTEMIAQLLEHSRSIIETFTADPEEALLVLEFLEQN
jgi:predicted nuclease of predicted toxin-antitoxin system